MSVSVDECACGLRDGGGRGVPVADTPRRRRALRTAVARRTEVTPEVRTETRRGGIESSATVTERIARRCRGIDVDDAQDGIGRIEIGMSIFAVGSFIQCISFIFKYTFVH